MDRPTRIFRILAQYYWGFDGCGCTQGKKKEKGHGYSKAAAEVCKYALKFGDLSVEKTWEAFKVLKGKRLTGSFGLLWGVKIPDTMTDDMPEGDLPYLEMLYKVRLRQKFTL